MKIKENTLNRLIQHYSYKEDFNFGLLNVYNYIKEYKSYVIENMASVYHLYLLKIVQYNYGIFL